MTHKKWIKVEEGLSKSLNRRKLALAVKVSTQLIFR